MCCKVRSSSDSAGVEGLESLGGWGGGPPRGASCQGLDECLPPFLLGPSELGSGGNQATCWDTGWSPFISAHGVYLPHLYSAAQPSRSMSLFSFIGERPHMLTQWQNQDKSSGPASIAFPQFHLLPGTESLGDLPNPSPIPAPPPFGVPLCLRPQHCHTVFALEDHPVPFSCLSEPFLWPPCSLRPSSGPAPSSQGHPGLQVVHADA